MLRALQQLPVAQREALVLVGAGGLSYEETAGILGVAIGTVKSRVARGRDALEALVGGGKLSQPRQEFANEGDVVVHLLSYVEHIKGRGDRAVVTGPASVLRIAA
jgi:RNA polymerase sigma-70 factor (ECF subfamily)